MSAVRVAPSSIEGRGVFASGRAGPGEMLLVVDTSRVVTEDAPLRPEEGEREEHLAYLADGRTVLLSKPERHLNHSCDPNAYLQTVEGELRVVARRPIQPGEEITIDYLVNTHGGSSWRCRCGADRCRDELETSFFDLPLKLQCEYLPLLEDWFVQEHRDRVERLEDECG